MLSIVQLALLSCCSLPAARLITKNGAARPFGSCVLLCSLSDARCSFCVFAFVCQAPVTYRWRRIHFACVIILIIDVPYLCRGAAARRLIKQISKATSKLNCYSLSVCFVFFSKASQRCWGKRGTVSCLLTSVAWFIHRSFVHRFSEEE